MDDPHSLAAPYALDALDEDEERVFEQHLTLCDRCREQLAGFRSAAAALAYAPEGPAPPPELRERILQQARAERPNVVSLRRRRLPTWGVPAGIAAVAAGVAIGLGIWSATLSNSLDKERSARRGDARLLAILGDPRARTIPLSGASGRLVVTPAGPAALLVSSLKPLPHTRTYEAWVVRGAQPKPAGLFGGGRVAFALRSPVPPGARVAVTVERHAGAAKPTGTPLLTSGAA